MNPEHCFDRRTLKRLTWKESPMRTLALLIINRILRSADATIWPDELDLSGESSRVAPAVWRVLSAIQIIVQNGTYRRSQAVGRRGSLIFQYALHDRERAEVFLKLNQPSSTTPQQPEMTLSPVEIQTELLPPPTRYPKD